MLLKNKFKLIYYCLLCYLVVQPCISNKLYILQTIFVTGLTTLFLFSPYLLSRSKKWLIFGIVTFLVSLLMIIKSKNEVYFYSTNIFGLAAYGIVLMYLFQYIITQKYISADLIYASLCVYFFLAIGFAYAYEVLTHLGLVSFKPADIFLAKNNMNYLYYSFSTLTTLGYGDITPATPLAKRLSGIEAATGVLYVAVFIGRLIGMQGRINATHKLEK